MISLIVNSITARLNEMYDGTIPVIHEDLPQKWPEPCFYISTLETRKNVLLKDRFILNVPVDVHYFPSKSKTRKSEMNVKAMELMEHLRQISLVEKVEDNETEKLVTVGSLNGFNIHTEIVDDVLHFFVEYKPCMYYHETVDLMETADLNINGSVSPVPIFEKRR